jgi:hypothetical protein
MYRVKVVGLGVYGSALVERMAQGWSVVKEKREFRAEYLLRANEQ